MLSPGRILSRAQIGSATNEMCQELWRWGGVRPPHSGLDLLTFWWISGIENFWLLLYFLSSYFPQGNAFLSDSTTRMAAGLCKFSGGSFRYLINIFSYCPFEPSWGRQMLKGWLRFWRLSLASHINSPLITPTMNPKQNPDEN